jgi:hypothetical protein
MRSNDKLIRVYSGNEVMVNMLKGRLDIPGIYAAVQNDSGDSFLRGVTAAVDLSDSRIDIYIKSSFVL